MSVFCQNFSISGSLYSATDFGCEYLVGYNRYYGSPKAVYLWASENPI
jgi:hypothetical protein